MPPNAGLGGQPTGNLGETPRARNGGRCEPPIQAQNAEPVWLALLVSEFEGSWGRNILNLLGPGWVGISVMGVCAGRIWARLSCRRRSLIAVVG